MSGGQAITSGQGFLGLERSHGQAAQFSAGSLGKAVSVALVGAAIALSQGVANPNNGGTVPLSGEAVTLAQGSSAVSWGQDLSGSESTSAIQTAAITLRPTDLFIAAISSAAGDVAAEGEGAAQVHLSGSEATFAQGSVDSGSQLIGGLESTSAQGASALSVEMPIEGMSLTAAQSSLAPEQAADDTLATFGIGSVGWVASVVLTGIELAGGQGTMTVTGDAAIALTGEESTAEDGSLTHDESFPIEGLAAVSAQYNVGAPGYAALTGAEAAVQDGDVFTTNDRSFALAGVATAVQDGLTFASPLAFVDGQSLTSGLEGIGPRNAELSGVSIQSGQGYVSPPVYEHRKAAATVVRKNYIYKGKKYYVTLDELARMIRADADVTREDIVVSYQNKKPHKLSKAAFAQLADIAADTPIQDDEEDIEAILALL